MQIKNSKIVITGANRGIGLGLARSAAKRGAHLLLVMRSEDKNLKTELEKFGAASVDILCADLSSRAGTQELIEKLNPLNIDILINNAGQLTGGLIEEQPLDEIYSMFQVNLLSLIQLTRGLLPGMIKRGNGKVVNNASVSAIMHFPCASTYAAAKAGVMAFTNCIQAEVAATGVSTLTLITPGIKTRMFDDIEIKYSKNLEVPTQSISTDEYGELVMDAISDDRTYLMPTGSTSLGLNIAKYLPSLFNLAVAKKFKR